jgi:hypothetical protein
MPKGKKEDPKGKGSKEKPQYDAGFEDVVGDDFFLELPNEQQIGPSDDANDFGFFDESPAQVPTSYVNETPDLGNSSTPNQQGLNHTDNELAKLKALVEELQREKKKLKKENQKLAEDNRTLEESNKSLNAELKGAGNLISYMNATMRLMFPTNPIPPNPTIPTFPRILPKATLEPRKKHFIFEEDEHQQLLKPEAPPAKKQKTRPGKQ